MKDIIVKKDHLGLYLIYDERQIVRPFYGTQFSHGDRVLVKKYENIFKVTSSDKPKTHNFSNSGLYEWWCDSGISWKDYQKSQIPSEESSHPFRSFDEYLQKKTFRLKRISLFQDFDYFFRRRNSSFEK